MKPKSSPLLIIAALISLFIAAPSAKAAEPSRFTFNAYDGNPAKPAEMSFQINTLDLRQPIEFLKLGDQIPKTKLKLVGFAFKEAKGPNIETEDVSELTVGNVETGELSVLVLAKVVNIPGARKP